MSSPWDLGEQYSVFIEEQRRIREVYEIRDVQMALGHGHYLDIVDSYQRDLAVFIALQRRGVLPLIDKKIIDFGSGTGARLRDFIRLGAEPHQLYGLELSRRRIHVGRRISPNIPVVLASGAAAPFASETFDIALNFTMMSSVLSSSVSAAIAAEMLRVLRPGGVVLWYDLRYRNPWNPNVRPYGKREIRRLFSGQDVSFQSLTPVPSLTRRWNVPIWFYWMASASRWVRTHYLPVVQKKL